MVKANFAKGVTRISSHQIKKHISQMSPSEVKYLVDQLHRYVKYLQKSHHLAKKIADGKMFDIPIVDIMATVKSPNVAHNIIECNENQHANNGKIYQRVLLQLDKQYTVDINGVPTLCNAFAVIEIKSKQLVTTYVNAVDDLHDTLNTARYDPNLQIIRDTGKVITKKGRKHE